MQSNSSNAGTIKSYLPDNWPLLMSAFSAAYGIGLLSLLSLPFLIGTAMASFSLNEAQAGLLGTVEFASVMVISLIVAPLMGKMDRRKLVYMGFLVVLCANVFSVFANGYYLLLILRVVAGLGAGTVMACGNATVSNAKDPERFAGHMSVLAVFLMIFIMFVFSRVSEAWGLAGIYTAMCVTIIFMGIFLHNMPRNAAQKDDTAESSESHQYKALKITGLLMLGAFFAFSLRDTMAWAFVERIGSEAGFSGEQIGNLLSIQAMSGLIGPIIATIIGSRFGLKWPIIAGIFVSGLATYLVSASTDSKLLYIVGVMLMPGSYFYTLAYLTSLAAELDEQGRIVAASGSALMAGIAVGPAIGGKMIVSGGGYGVVGIAIIACAVLTLIFVLFPMASVQKKYSTSKVSQENLALAAEGPAS